MKLAQTFWTNGQSLQALKGGWLDARFHLYAWALSYARLSHYTADIEISTDSFGAELCQKLGLNYRPKLIFDTYQNPVDESLWLLRKMYSYSQHQEPFLHIDGDAFLWQNPITLLNNSPLLAQNLEQDFPSYQAIQKAYPAFGLCQSINTGLVGGLDFEFYQRFYLYACDQIQCVDYQNFNAVEANLFTEQMLLWAFAKQENKTFDFAFDAVVNFDSQYAPFSNLTYSPFVRGYAHIMGLAKQNPVICENLAQCLLIENRDLYERVNDVCRGLNKTIAGYEPKPIDYRSKAINTAPSQSSAVLGDVLDYEHTLGAYQQSLSEKSSLSTCVAQGMSLKIGLEQIKQGIDVKIAPNKDCPKICSGWLWAERCELEAQNMDYQYEENIGKEEAYFEVLLLNLPHVGIVREFLLDPLNMIILEVLEQPLLLSVAVNAIKTQMTAYGFKEHSQEINQNILERIYFFLSFGVINIC